MGKITVEYLKRKYPNPVKWSKSRGKSRHNYCVGGALCLEVFASDNNFKEGYPTINNITEAICRINPDIPLNKARSFAYMIVLRNDNGKIAEAWDALEAALTWK